MTSDSLNQQVETRRSSTAPCSLLTPLQEKRCRGFAADLLLREMARYDDYLGRGTRYALAMAPVIKVATNSHLATRWFDLIDVDAGRIATGDAGIAEVGWEIFHLMIDVASGRHTVAADRLGLRNDLVLFNPAPVT